MAFTATDLTADNMRKVVEEEGLEARNLLNWNVIVSDKSSLDVPKTSKKPPTSPRPQSASPRPPTLTKDSESHVRSSNRCSSLGRPKTRLRSSSAGRNPDKCVRARYWAFLFENLYRAVDEIYQTCEVDESIVESKEAIMMLENYCKEFQALIQWLTISKNYEVTPPRNRPTSLAWEVRKSLPTKGLLRNIFLDKLGASSSARRKLDLQGSVQSTAVQTELEVSQALLTHNPLVQNSDLLSKILPTIVCNDEVCHAVSNGSAIHAENVDPLLDDTINNSNKIHTDEVCHVVDDTINNKSSTEEVCHVTNDTINSEICTEVCDIADDTINSEISTEEVCLVVNDTIISEIPTEEVFHIVDSTINSEILTEEVCHLANECINSSNEIHADEVQSICEDSFEDLNQKKFSVEFLGRDERDDFDSDGNCLVSIHSGIKITEVNAEKVQESKCVNEIVENVAKLDLSISNSDAESSTNKESLVSMIPSEKNIPELKVSVHAISNNVPELLTSQVSVASQTESESKDLQTCNILLKKIINTSSTSHSQPINTSAKSPPINSSAKSLPINSSAKSPPINISAKSSPINPTAKSPPINISAKSSPINPTAKFPPMNSSAKSPTISSSTKNQPINITVKAQPINSSVKPQPVNTLVKIQPVNSSLKSQSVNSSLKPQPMNSSNKPQSVNTPAKPQPFNTPAKPQPFNTSAKPQPFNTSAKPWKPPGIKVVHTKLNFASKLQPKVKNADDVKNVYLHTSGTTNVRSGNAQSSASISKFSYQRPANRYSGTPFVGKSRTSENNLNKDLLNTKMKSVSSTSLNSSFCGKAKKSDVEGNLDNAEDSDGWETVRGRTRCKNSPAKKIISSNGAYDAAKINQAKVGGFPYTCTSNAPMQKKPTKPSTLTSKSTMKNTETGDSKSSSKATDSKTGNKKGVKESVPVEPSKKVNITLKQNENSNKGLESTKSSANTKSSSEKQLTSKNSDLRKSYSCSSFETKKSEMSKTCGKNESNKTKVKPMIPGNVRPVEKDSALQHPEDEEFVESKSKEMEKVDCTTLENSHEQKVENHLPTKDSHQLLSLSNSSDDSDELISQDEEAMNDSETIEMYEKMIREEAQEHISELGLSWGDQMDLLDMELRTPGRALQMHEKLSSPFRKRTLAETIRRHEEKQMKAQEQRERFLEEKAQHFKDIQKKVEEMKALNEKKQEQQRISLEQRLQRAEEKRKKELEKIIRKAHDEEEKVNEIAFINSLEAQNKRHDLISKEKDHEARLQDIQGERQRKLEEKAAKEAAAEERRKVLEAERQARLLEMQEKRKQRDLKIEQQLLEKEKERQELANQKARERELRLSALNAAQQATLEELQKKIQLKQEESARRHEENIEQIRQKAFELSVRRYSSYNDDAPQLVPYETKKICTICNVLIASEVYLLSHLRGKKHQEMIALQHQGHDPSTEELELYNLKHIVNAPADQIDPNIALDKERLKALKKRCKKLRQRMANRGAEYEKNNVSNVDLIESKHKQKMVKLINEMKKFTSVKGSCDSGTASSIERSYSELGKLFRICQPNDKVLFRNLGGISAIMDLLVKIATPLPNNNTLVSSRIIVQGCKVTLMVFQNCYENSIDILLTNKVGLILDVLVQKLKGLIPDNFVKLVQNLPPIDEVAGELMHFLGVVLDYLTKKKINDSDFWAVIVQELKQNPEEEFRSRINDIVSYTVSIGIVDRLSQYFNSIRSTIDSKPDVGIFLMNSMSFLVAVVKLSSDSYMNIFESKKVEDTTQLLATLKMTDLVGSVSLLYCILLHDGLPALDETPPQKLPEHTILLTLAALRMLNHSAVLNLHAVQTMLGNEGLSLQLRHIANYLLWYCKNEESSDLMHEIILLIGIFTALNPDNQLVVHAGQTPSVLKQLSTLPFQYFSNNKLCDILFPTLISCCFNNDCNKSILEKEMSIQLLSNYIEGYLLDVYNSSAIKNDANIRWKLHSRFPKHKWTAAKTYFTS